MKITHAISAAVAVSALALTTQAAQVFNINNVTGGGIQFNGAASSFQFLGGSNQWSISSQSGGTGTSVGLTGAFLGGPFSYGAITTSGLSQTAPVLTTGTLRISDGVNLGTARVDWYQVSTYQAFGGLNASATIDLSNLSYTGSNPDLVSFFSSPAGRLVLSFQFNPAMSLTQLTSGNGPYINSFSGTLEAIPEPASALMLGLGLLLFGARRFFRN